MPHSYSVMQPLASVQLLIDEHSDLIMARPTGMAKFSETKHFVSELATVFASVRLVVTTLLSVYDPISAEAQRLSGNIGVPLQCILLERGDSYRMSSPLTGLQPILRAGGFGNIAHLVDGAGTQHISFKGSGMSRCCRRCRTRYLAALVGRPSCLPCLQPPRCLRWPRSTCPQSMIRTRGW